LSRETGKEVALPLGTRVDRGGSHREAEGDNLSSRSSGGGGLGTDFDLAGGIQYFENHAQDSRVSGPHDIAGSVASKYGTGGGNTPLVSMTLTNGYGSNAGQDMAQDGALVVGTLTRKGPYAMGAPEVDAGHYLPFNQGTAIRRLTPRECERLQGFPDDFTLVPVRGKPAADGPRYKALGNSMAVPVMSWIGKRIEAESKR
jgi:DNA (cytosine-5)-methyltransferase 1